MPRQCEPCRVHVADDNAVPCLRCQQPMGFTFQSPSVPDEHAHVLPEHDDLRRRPNRAMLQEPNPMWKAFWKKFGPIPLWVGFLTCVAFGWYFFTTNNNQFNKNVEELKPGMPVLEAMKMFGDDNSGKRVGATFHFDGSGKGVTFGDKDAALDIMKKGSVEYESGKNGVRIHFDRGVVTRVEKYEAMTGMKTKFVSN
jgi:hypothetical protein